MTRAQNRQARRVIWTSTFGLLAAWGCGPQAGTETQSAPESTPPAAGTPAVEIRADAATEAQHGVHRWRWTITGSRIARVHGLDRQGAAGVEADVTFSGDSGQPGIDVHFMVPEQEVVSLRRDGSRWTSTGTARQGALAVAMLSDNESALRRQRERSNEGVQPKFLEWLIFWIVDEATQSANPPPPPTGLGPVQAYQTHCFGFAGLCAYYDVCERVGGHWACDCVGAWADARPPGCGPGTATFPLSETWCSAPGEVRHTGDFNGDGRKDMLCRSSRRVQIDYANASGYLDGVTDWQRDSQWCTHNGAKFYVGDFNGDRRTDFLCRDPESLWIDYADQNGQFAWEDWYYRTRWCTHAGSEFNIADYNGDGRVDLFCKDPGAIWIDYADQNGRFAWEDWYYRTAWCTHAGSKLHFGDFNGDRRTDLLCKDAAAIWIDYADQNGKFAWEDWYYRTAWCTHAGAQMHVQDANGDGRSDILCGDTHGRRWIDHADEQGRFASTDVYYDR